MQLYHKDKLTLIIKPTSRCNCRCVYCYNSLRAEKSGIMDTETLRLLLTRITEYCRETHINRVELIWHGGEPLLMGPEFYEKIHTYSSHLASVAEVSQAIQTNLLLFDKAFVPIFKDLRIKISTSLDPCRGIRLTRKGEDHLDTWVHKLCEALDAGFHIGLICVLHKKHLPIMEEVFQYFQNLYAMSDGRIGLRYNVLYPAGSAGDGNVYRELGLIPEEYGETLVRLWHYWNRSGRIQRQMPPMSEWAGMFERTNSGRCCAHSKNCAEGWLGIDEWGNVYNCGRHMASAAPFGNIHDAPLASIVHNPERAKLFQRAEMLANGQCRDCPIWDKCYGGCPDDSFLFNGTFMQKSHWCKSYLTFYEKVFAQNV
ncbi:MAG: radical SAM protein [Syntrophobacteraceae bacterium]